MDNNETLHLKVHGHILRELSEKLPNYAIALNELLKNSYDACAHKVTVTISKESNAIIIEDDGVGMNISDIETLLHLSASKKRYGMISECNRRIQGSKGLGFLSVFKFGHIVKWLTVSNNTKCVFSFDYNSAVEQNELGHYDINLGTMETNEHTGTRIEITSSRDNINEMISYFKQPNLADKVVNSFLDESFLIEFDIDGKKYKTDFPIDLNSIKTDKILYRINYDSINKKIIYSNYGGPLFDVSFPQQDDRFQIELDLSIYDLTDSSTRGFPCLFKIPNGTSLTPLVFTNNNLFSNYKLWDNNINRQYRTEYVLPQIIGVINIISSDPKMEFNAERSDFVVNDLTQKIRDTLFKLNRTIQTEGAIRKKYLTKLDFIDEEKLKLTGDSALDSVASDAIKPDFSFKELVQYTISGNEVTYNLHSFKKSYQLSKIPNHQNPVSISDNIPKEIFTKQAQFDIRKYISSAQNSTGKDIRKDIIIKINGETKNIVQSFTEPCDLTIELSYHDEFTGEYVIKREVAVIDRKSSPRIIVTKDQLIDLSMTRVNYTFDFSSQTLKLIEEINELYMQEDKKLHVLCTSIRAVFELCLLALIKNEKFTDIIKQSEDKGNNLSNNIKAIIAESKKSATIRSLFSHAIGETSNNVKALLLPDDYEVAIRKSNFGAHTSSSHLTLLDIENMGKRAAYFAILCNEIIKNYTEN